MLGQMPFRAMEADLGLVPAMVESLRANGYDDETIRGLTDGMDAFVAAPNG